MASYKDSKAVPVACRQDDGAGLKFWVEPGRQSQLFGTEAPNWTDPSGDKRAELIKTNPRRRIWRVRLGELDVYVKRYELGGLVGAAKSLFRLSPVATEFKNYRLARSAGINCPEPLAFGQKGFRGMGGPSVLLTAAVWPATPLDVYLAEHGMDDELLRLLAEILGRGHRAGLLHPDPHLGNFLLCVDAKGQRQLVLTDLQKLQRTRLGHGDKPVAALGRAARWNLALFYCSVIRHLSKTQRERFLAEYLRVVRPEQAHLDRTVGQLLGEIERLVWKRRQHKWAKHDRRCRFTNKYFALIRLGGYWKGSVFLGRKEVIPGSVASGSKFTVSQWQRALKDLDGLFAGGQVEKLRDSGGTLLVRRCLQVAEISLSVYGKLVRAQGGRLSRVMNLGKVFGRPALQRAFEVGWALARRQIPAIVPLAWLAKGKGVDAGSEVLISEAIAGGKNLEEFIRSQGEQVSGRQKYLLLKELAEKAGQLAGALERHGYRHGDFQPRKILVQQFLGGGQRLVLAGLEEIRRARWPNKSDRLDMAVRAQSATQNWAQISRTLRLRFLLKFLEQISEPRNKWQWYWQQIGERAKGRIASKGAG